ncbi:putative thiol methyltransferase 2 isoform X2 [Iris pallida]|uniref:Thiol methyltransferase 2 isoform X2 n=1 Tax=Iris pallida TaxID=29817 RepID=A0AAX6HKT6_IRIPA|nr:putative thiol methyltransferase 2 isoform X2 [Iris pallida]
MLRLAFQKRPPLINRILVNTTRRCCRKRRLSPFLFLLNSISRGGMGSNSDDGVRDPNSNPKVTKFRQLMSNHNPTDGWQKSWEEGLTPWDLGQPTPIILHLLQTGTLPEGRVLIPGCGSGYDVIAIANPVRYVVGLDISTSAINKAKEWSSSLPNAKYFTLLAADFFTWQPTELFDLVFDYTFFCALDPSMRPSWAKRVSEILKPDGELITLIYLMNDQDGGPPYNNSLADYDEVLRPMGFTALSIVDNELAIGPRKEMTTGRTIGNARESGGLYFFEEGSKSKRPGKEKLGWWKRNCSSL